MAEARQMSLFGVDRARDDELKYGLLVQLADKWQPGYREGTSIERKFTVATVQRLLRDAGETCRFAEARDMLARLRIEGWLPETEEEEE